MGDIWMFGAMVAILDSEWGIIIALIAVVILFGSAKLPKFARSLGSAQSEFKKGLAEGAADSDSKSSNSSDSEEKASAGEQKPPSSIEQTTLSSTLEQKISSLEKKIASLEHKSPDSEAADTKSE
jgi:sec-independent protein translocase protein TatA